MSLRVRPLLLVCAALGAAALAPGVARADGDPASDVLLTAPAFVPADAEVSSAEQARLTALLTGAQRADFPVRVAIVPNAYDLGSVAELWAKPRAYAEFLGVELSLVYKGPLLVVMPDGFGVHWAGHRTDAAYRALAQVRIGSTGNDLAAAAYAATGALAASAGVRVASPATTLASASHAAPSSHTGSTSTVAIIVGGVAAMVAIIAAGVWLTGRRRRQAGTIAAGLPPSSQPAPASAPGRPPSRAIGAGPPVWLQVAMPAVAVVFAVVVVVLVSGLRHSDQSSSTATATAAEVPAATSQQGEPLSWPAGRQPAPNFQLTDQQGRPVSVAAYRGHPVILTFIDPLCRENCPLAAQVLSRVDRQLPAAQRPVILAVSVDVYGNARANLLEDYGKWHLAPQWQWAVGAPSRLAEVWKHYYAEVEVTNKHIAGVTVHFITHSEMAYVIDPHGYERALLAWPYSPRQVEQAVERVTSS